MYTIRYPIEIQWVDEDGNPIPDSTAARLFIDALDGKITIEACERHEDDAE